MSTWEEEQKKYKVLSDKRHPDDMSIEDFNIMHGINEYNQYVPRGTSYEIYLRDQNRDRELSDKRHPDDMSIEDFNASDLKDDSSGPSGFSYAMYIGDQDRARKSAEYEAKKEREYKERETKKMNDNSDKKAYSLNTRELLPQLGKNVKADMSKRLNEASTVLTTGFNNVRNRFRKQNVNVETPETPETSEMNVDGGKKRRTKKRGTKKRGTKKRSTKKRSTKKRSTKKRSTKRH
jgi:hypothetical protein